MGTWPAPGTVRRDVAAVQPTRARPASAAATLERAVSRQDPGETTGHGVYPPTAPPCTCREIQAVHEVKDGRRGRVSVGYPTGPSTCPRYTPEATDAH